MNVKEATAVYRSMWTANLSDVRTAQQTFMASGYRGMAFALSDCIAVRKEIIAAGEIKTVARAKRSD